MAATTAFYGSIRTAKEFMSIIVDIDTKLTTLQMVSGQSDLSGIFERAIESAERYGQSISKVMDATVEFARQGYKGEDLNTLADTAVLFGNVGDIESGKAAEYLTATLAQWRMETEDSMKVLDAWNELSNNYATTSEKIAQGNARSAATAKAVGVSFDNNLSK